MGGFLMAGVGNWEDELSGLPERRVNYAIYDAVFHALESAPDSAMFHRISKEVFWLVDKGADDVIDDAVDRTLRTAKEETEDLPPHPALQDFLCEAEVRVRCSGH